MSTPITISPVKICKLNEISSYIRSILIIEYKLGEKQSEIIISKHLDTFLATLKDQLYAVIEYPYVDKMYRDAYYNYYSAKFGVYNRDTCRISFFEKEIDYNHFRDIKVVNQELIPGYLGFLVIRPTFPKIIGRNAISPKAIKKDNIVCCLAKINATANSVKFKVLAFPHASQDNQTITCAETTIWTLSEYFGNKFPDYKPVLPSHITRVLHKFSYKRLIPSDGLTAEQVTYAVRELGFGAMIYSKSKYEPNDFNSIISTYIESGIPVIGVIKGSGNNLGHAFNIVGREKDKPEDIIQNMPTSKLKNGIEIVDYAKILRSYVIVDDNYPPYQATTLEFPCRSYYEDSKWQDCEIKNIIVPLHPRIYLDAVRARKNFYKVMDTSKLGLKGTDRRVIRIFLAASRSYKEYVSTNKKLHSSTKELILTVQMPKFIWVAEVSKLASFARGECDGFLIQDATEPLEYSDKTMLSYHSILTGFMDGTVFIQRFGNFEDLVTFAGPFEAYNDNLK